jgi:hypothetical protein
MARLVMASTIGNSSPNKSESSGSKATKNALSSEESQLATVVPMMARIMETEAPTAFL